MKKFFVPIILIAVTGILFIGCTESPVSPVNQPVSLDKKGPVVHSAQGSGLLFVGEKSCGARYTAHEYADGSFDGTYEINSANAAGDPTFKINGDVISFKVYENAGQYGGKMAVFYGQEKTEIFAGFYDLFFAIDNGIPGQTTNPDQVNWILMEVPSLDFTIPAEWGTDWTGMTITQIYETSTPDDFISNLGVADCDHGNVTVK